MTSEVVEVDGALLLERANALNRRIDAIAETVFDTICVNEATIAGLRARITEYVLEVSVLKAELRKARLAVVEARGHQSTEPYPFCRIADCPWWRGYCSRDPACND